MFLTSGNKLRWNWIAWGAVIVATIIALGIAWFDRPVYLFFRAMDCGIWNLFDRVFDAWIWIAVTGSLVLLVYLKNAINSGVNYKNDKNWFSVFAFVRDGYNKIGHSYAFYVLASVVSASIVAKVLKIIIGRARPVFFEALGMTGFFPFNTEWAFNSMPSGHTTATFAGLVMIGMLVPQAKVFTWTLAIIVGASRVCHGAHWPTDVVFGAFIGMVVADIVLHYLRHVNTKK